jgi:hypothetical protein
MSQEVTFVDCVAFIPHAIEPHWDNVWAPRLAGFPVNIIYAARIEGTGLAHATYVFDPGTFVEGEQSRQMRYRPTIDSDFSVLVVLHREGRIDTFKYRGSDLICEAWPGLPVRHDSHYRRWLGARPTVDNKMDFGEPSD